MKLLIVCATQAEFNHPSLSGLVQAGISGSHTFKHKHIDVTLLITGAGMINTMYFLQKKIHESRYDLAINVGIAGCFDKNAALGTVYQVSSDEFAEMGAEDGDQFISIFDLGLVKPDQFPFVDGKLNSYDSFDFSSIRQLPKAVSITVNKVHGHEGSIQKIRTLYNPGLESMEGAAFFYVCLQENIPFLQIRSVSNIIETRNRAAWNIPLALKNLQNTVDNFLDELAERYPI